jgi:ribosome-associated protein
MFDKEAVLSELEFKATRSSGSGGQHVNKVATKVELSFNIESSQYLSELQKSLLKKRYKNRISKHGVLSLSSDATRSQLRNKEKVIGRFLELLEAGLQPQKKRKTTKIPATEKKKRLENKKRQSEKKINRRPPKIS